MRISLLLFLLAGGLPLCSQSLRLEGRLLDAETGAPLAYGQVRALAARVGVLSNEDGEFVIQLPGPRDTLLLQQLGYEALRLPLQGPGAWAGGEIRLAPKEYSLPEVTIRYQSAEDMLRAALDALRENHKATPYQYEGFYRELVSRNGEPVELNEAVFEVRDYPNFEDDEETDALRLIKGRSRRNPDAPEDSIQARIGPGGPQGLVHTPIIGQAMTAHFLEKKHFDLYEYRLLGVTEWEGRNAYVITFDQSRRQNIRLYQGTILLDVNTLAFVSLEYQLSSFGEKFRLRQILSPSQQALLALLRLTGIQISIEEHSSRLMYSFQETYWRPMFYEAGLRMIVSGPEKYIPGGRSDLRFELLMNVNRRLPGRSISSEARFSSQTRLSEVAGPYEDAFWESYNFQKPAQSLRAIAREMQK